MRRDENALLYISKEEEEAFELRQDVISLRSEYHRLNQEAGRNDARTREVLSRLRYRLTILSDIAVTEKRTRYFDEADKLRALSRSVQEAFPDSGKQADSKHYRKFILEIGVETISNFMHRSDLGGKARSQKFVDMLFEFLSYIQVDERRLDVQRYPRGGY